MFYFTNPTKSLLRNTHLLPLQNHDPLCTHSLSSLHENALSLCSLPFHENPKKSSTPTSLLKQATQSREMFDPITHMDTVSANHLLSSYNRQGLHKQSLRLFSLRKSSSQPVDHVTLALALKACCSIGPFGLNIGRLIQSHAIVIGFQSHVTVCNSLLNLYFKRAQPQEAIKMFRAMPQKDLITYNTAIAGFAQNQMEREAIQVLLQMQASEMPSFDRVSFASSLNACASLSELSLGHQIHALSVIHGHGQEIFVQNALVSMYARCNSIREAKEVFNGIVFKDLVSWNSMISGYNTQGEDNYGNEAIELFANMVHGHGPKPDHITFVSVLSACVGKQKVELGRQCHCQILRTNKEKHVSVCNKLISLYSKSEATLGYVERVFDFMVHRNIVSWTSMISLYKHRALGLFNEMRLQGVSPNQVTFVALIHSISDQGMEELGPQAHGLTVRTRLDQDINVANSLITMYAKFQNMDSSQKVFDGMIDAQEIVSYNAIMAGYAQNELYTEAVEVYFLLASYDNVVQLRPTEFTFVSVISSCAGLLSLGLGRRLHCQVAKLGFSSCVFVGSALLDMYAKCGSIEDSERVFSEMDGRSLVTWTGMISGYAQHGECHKALSLLEEMRIARVSPDPVTFLAVLSACGRVGMVDQGLQCFESMALEHGIEPHTMHHSCMVDMLGRAGRLREAEEVVKRKPSIRGWQSLLGACRNHGEVEMGKRAAETLMAMEPEDSATYVLLSNMYAAEGNWEEVAKVRRRMRDGRVRKEVACSWVDAGEKMHGFTTNDMSHPEAREICNVVVALGQEMRHLEDEFIAQKAPQWTNESWSTVVASLAVQVSSEDWGGAGILNWLRDEIDSHPEYTHSFQDLLAVLSQFF
ncbi:pentatricopeptide repeat-containing protein At4g32430, mitochondrial [Amborella trichopoda]|uniref:pentatricopeptide repeat-containing protein At4g32430, mitochondrial n=1 Tax=Amborella trichopoda TaxID=13333 RepID=UPI0009BFC122|nr:pentatricopeptide repeat-containing protein At4g32430, mitochondrial [Amborella trichopoda]|eukprot:XP_020527537.1 pentatricopeptide repeat-containing protein At4g32430, mitochondrial [Amborella trichopoda]